MKLKDLVANSLPRVRGRKKKTSTSVCDTGATGEAAAKAEIVAGRGSLDKGKNRLQTVSFRSDSRDDTIEMQGITEASWRGNALYRGLEAARAVKFNSKLMSTSYTSSHGMVTSHSAEGFSSQMMLSRSFDSRMTVPDCSDSCPQMLSVCDSRLEPFSPPQQYYHCHYHQHSHHHYHHHHLHAKPMTSLAQNQQQLYPEVAGASCLSACKVPEEEKSEPGFFRKSFASFRSMRKHSNKSHKDMKQKGTDKSVCSVCPYPEAAAASSIEKKSTDSKRPAKPKRKSLKVLAKQKENKELGQSDKSWYSDNDTHKVASSSSARNDSSISVLTTRERHQDRERSLESCSSRLYGSREGSCVREVDFTGFDSASLSGYESDLPRGKVHRSRSRIKTNPWLPSPQPSMSGEGRGQKFDLRESTEDIVKLEESIGRVARSASFEHQRSGTLSTQPSFKTDSPENKIVHRPRSVTPTDNKLSMSLAPHSKTSSSVIKPTWWEVNQESAQTFGSKENPRPKVEVFNDLSSSSTVSKSRPTSTVSPNSEFVMLADNLEQLANNISFEYEELLDTTLESVSICQEDGQTSIQGSFTDEENVEVSKTCLKSEGDLHNAHSPDSGVGGLGSTDGDENLGPNSQRLQVDLSTDGLPHAGSVRCYGSTTGSDSNLEIPVFHKMGHSHSNRSAVDMKCSSFLLSDSCDYNTQTASPKLKISRDKICILDTGSSATLSESDIDNTSYHEISHNELQKKKQNAAKLNGNVVSLKQQNSRPLGHDAELGCSPKTAKLMVDERLDIQFQPAHRQFHGCGIVMGTGGAMHDHVQLGIAGKQMLWKSSDTPAVVTCRHPRPCAFKTSPGLSVLRKMNDIEKGYSEGQQRRSWSVEFDIPRNITECVESPTENWQCVDGFSLGRSAEVLAHSQILPQRLELENKAVEPADVCDNSFRNEELVVDLTSVTASGRYHHKGIESCETGNLMDCSRDKIGAESDGSCSEMNDACVQTDFDEDWSRWEEADTLEGLEDKALDPAESTRLWLLTGNMQGSADTGYSSLTRESQIYMDEDTLLLAGEIEETAAAERLSFIESSDVAIPTDVAPNDTDYHDPCTVPVSESKGQTPETRRPATLVDKEQARQQSATVTKAGLEKELLPADLLSLSDISYEPASHSPRTIPHSTVHKMFSNIESQFQEIFQKIYEDKSRGNPATKRTSSDSSDCTLKSSDTEDLEARGRSTKSLECIKSKDSETGEVKASMPLNVNRKKDFLNTPASVKTPPSGKNFQTQAAPLQAPRCCRHATETTVSKSVEFSKPKHELQSLSSKRGPFLNAAMYSPAASSSHAPVTHERADYLEFLKDAPLDRLHLKRPLFLVPGVGPVDMSSSEQLNLFTDHDKSGKKGPLPCSSVSSSASPSSMFSSTAHCGKKLKYKKGDHQSTSDYPRPKEQVAKQHNPLSSGLTNNHPNFAQPMVSFLCKDHPNSNSSAQACSGHGANNETWNRLHYRGINPTILKPQHPALPPLFPSVTKTPLSDNIPRTAEERKQKDDAIRNMTERVICLRREQDMVFQKIQEVRLDERLRHQHQLQLQKHLHTQRKEALLETLNDLKHKLEEQSKLLKKKDDSNDGDGTSA